VRGLSIIWLVVIHGFLPIYFIERTISLNHVDLGSSLANSSGQMLALLVAVFTPLGFVLQVVGNYIDGKKRREDFKNRLVMMDGTIAALTSALEKNIETNAKKVRDFKYQESVDAMYRGLVSSLSSSKPSGSEPRESLCRWKFGRFTQSG